MTPACLQVRCCDFDRDTKRLVTLDVLGNTILWDPLSSSNMRVTRQFRLRDNCREECTCMLLDQNMLSIGARECVTFYDARQRDCIASAPLAKIGYGHSFPHPAPIAARSLAVRGCLLSIGLSTGGGVMFIDKRKMSSCVTQSQSSQRSRAKYSTVMAACSTSQGSTAVPAPVMSSLYHQTISAGEPLLCA